MHIDGHKSSRFVSLTLIYSTRFQNHPKFLAKLHFNNVKQQFRVISVGTKHGNQKWPTK